MKVILKTLVGSRAHGLAAENSDYDYRGVYITPTHEILSIDHRYKGTNWLEGKEDNTSYEVGHFLHLATKCNPTILETLIAPIKDITDEGWELREMFKHLWNPQDAFNAFVGYGHNQRKKFLEKKDDKPYKYASAYLRVLYQLNCLLEIGIFPIDFTETEIYPRLKSWKEGFFGYGEVIDQTKFWTDRAETLLLNAKNPQYNLKKVNGLLLSLRKRFWRIKR